MSLPLYQGANPQQNEDCHAGLWYDRCFDGYTSGWKVMEAKEGKDGQGGKVTWINKMVAQPVGDQAMLQKFAERQAKLMGELKGISMHCVTQWHFVTGLGNNHPVENGFAWHPTLGVPYLTGAAVKGMLRGWCEAWLGWKEGEDDHLKWFGSTDAAGEIIFFDAIPTEPVQLITDIMTPHYGDWYAEGDQPPKADGSNVPADWHAPKPIPFLAVAPNQTFQFSIARRTASKEPIQKVLDEVLNALEHLGAGAKTAAGYGRMVDPVQKKLEQWRSEPVMEQNQQAIEWGERMKNSSSEKERQSIAKALKTYYQQTGRWEHAKKKQRDRVDAIREILGETNEESNHE